MEAMTESNEIDSNYININLIESTEELPNHEFEEEVVDCMGETAELTVSVESCVVLNKAYQESLEELKQYLISKRRENESRQNELKSNTDHDSVKDITLNNCGYTHPNSLIPFMAPYFKDIKGLSAPFNEDVIEKKRNGEINSAFVTTNKPWNLNERQRMLEIIQMHSMELSQKPFRDEKEKLTKNKKSISTEVMEKISELTQQIDKIGEQTLSSIRPPDRGDQSIDWLKVATILDSDHSADDCEIYWNNFVHPDINKNEWTQEEDEKLEALVQKYGTRDWERVAQELESGRLAWQCCSRYQMEFNRDLKRIGPLTKAEAETVEKVIESCRVGDYIPWHQVSYFIEGRTLPQIKHYWHKINVPKRGDVWTDEENKVLTAAVKKYGTHNWRKVSYYLPGRSNRQCRERYMMRLNFTDRKLGNWTKSEDKEILRLAQIYDYKWVKLEEHIKGRNARQIASRYDLLMKYKSNGTIQSQTKNKSSIKSKCGTRTLSVRNRLFDRIRSIINRSKGSNEDLDQILRTGRAKLAKRLELECKGINLTTKGRPKKTMSEENLETKICQMFALYDHKSSPKKAIARGVQDQCVYDTTKQIIKEILTGNKCDSRSELANAIRLLISNFITSNNIEPTVNDSQNEAIDEGMSSLSPPIFPPNRTNVKGLRALLMQTDYLSQKIAKSKIKLEEYSAAVPEDENYTKLSAQFKSVFCWPALLSLINAPQRTPQQKLVNTNVKPKRRSWLTTDTSRMIQIRTNQTKLIQTAMQVKEENEETVIGKELINESSTASPWYLQPRQRRYYNLKSLDKNSFVFTRVKPRHEVTPHLDESQESSSNTSTTNRSRKRKSTGDTNNESCDGSVNSSQLSGKTLKNNDLNVEQNECASNGTDVSNHSEAVTTKKKRIKTTTIKSEPKVINTRSGNRSSQRIASKVI